MKLSILTIPRRIVLFSLIGSIGLFTQCKEKPVEVAQSHLSTELRQILSEYSLGSWYPRVIDHNNGGYYSNFSSDWSKEPEQNKFIVTQARHVWTLSKAAEFFPEQSAYSEYASHGFQFLKNHMWDDEYGGFHQLVDSTGTPIAGSHAEEKRAYGNAFGIYALAAYAKLTQQPEALIFAQKAFTWFDEHARDPINGGYFQYLEQDGTPIPRSALQDGYDAGDYIHVGLKDYNSSIHILEAFTELYAVWPDSVVRARLQEMYNIVSGPMLDERGFLKLYFYPDWTLASHDELIELAGGEGYQTNHVTFGHDVETAFLLIEAAHALGISEDQILPIAKNMVDHSLEKGWDGKLGGFYEMGIDRDGTFEIVDHGKNWWAQSEGLHSLLLMHTYFPEGGYYKDFELMYDYINKNLLDHQNKGWYSRGVDHHPEAKEGMKAQIWKGNYHTARALMGCISMLEGSHH